MKLFLLLLLPFVVVALRAEDPPPKAEIAAKEGETPKLRFGYPDEAATIKEILDTGIMGQNKDGSLTPYVPKHAQIDSGEHKLFLVWEMNPWGGSAVFMEVQGYTHTTSGWVRFLSTRFEGVLTMKHSIDAKTKALVLTEGETGNSEEKGTVFYTRRLDTIRFGK